MIAKLSDRVANWLQKSNAISEEDTELYSYAVYSLVFGVAPIAIALGFGLLFGMVPQALLLIAPFMLIRKFSGGYHLDSPVVCFLSSCLLVALSLGLTRWLTVAEVPMWYHVLVLLSTVSLYIQSPIDSEARRLSEAETLVFRRVARWMAVFFLGIYFLLVVVTDYNVSVPVGMGILIAALLQIPCTILKLAERMQSPAKKLGGSIVGTLPMVDPPSFLQKCRFIRQKRRFIQTILHFKNNIVMIQITLDPLSYNPIAHRFGRLWQPQRLRRMYTCTREKR